MGYQSEKNKGLASLEGDPRLFNSLGNNLLTRFVSQGVRSVDDIVRGLGRAGGAVLTDVAEVVKEPLGAGLEASGVIDREKREEALGPAGWWTRRDPVTGEDAGRGLSSLSDLVLPMAESFGRTGQLLADVVNPVEYGRAFSDPENSRLVGYGREIVERPFDFSLEHIGNIAIGGSIAGKGAQLGRARSAGALTTEQALRGIRPFAGRGARQTARSVAQEAAEAGSRSARMSLFAEDIVGHPYRSAWNAANKSRPAQLFRNPISRAEGRRRFAATIGSQEASFNFRQGDARRDWNEAVREYRDSFDPYGSSWNASRNAKARSRLEEARRNMQARGYDTPQDRMGMPEEVDPNMADPADVVAEQDFGWMGERDHAEFTERLLGPIDVKVNGLFKKAEPDSVGYFTDNTFGDEIVYRTNSEGRVVGALTIHPESGINIAVDPSMRGQGIATEMVMKAVSEVGEDSLRTALKTTTMSEMGAPLAESIRQLLEAKNQMGEAPSKPQSIYERVRNADPDEYITVYRGVEGLDLDRTLENPGAWWADEDAAFNYIGGRDNPGGGSIIEARIRARDLIDDPAYDGLMSRFDSDIQIDRITEYDYPTGEPREIYRGGGPPPSSLPDNLEDVFSRLDESPTRSRVNIPDESITPRSNRLPTTAQAINENPSFAISRWEAIKEWATNNENLLSAQSGVDASFARHELFNAIDNLIEEARTGRVSDVTAGKARTTLGMLEADPQFRQVNDNYNAARRQVIQDYIRENVTDDADVDALTAEAIAKADEVYPRNDDPYVAIDPLTREPINRFHGTLQDIFEGRDLETNFSELDNISEEAFTFSEMMREAFGGEEGSIANPFAPKAGRDPRRMGPVDLFANEAGHLRNQFLDSEYGQRFSAPAREARRILRDRNNALRSGEGPIAQRAFDGLASLRGRGARGVNHALDARTTEAKVLRGLHSLSKRPEGADYGNLLKRIDLNEPSGVSDRATNVRDVTSGRRAIGANLSPDKLVHNIVAILDEAKAKAKTAEDITNEVGRIVPGVDAESLTLLALDAVEKAQKLPEGSLGKALGDYIQGDTYLLDVNRRAQALMRKNRADSTPSRFRISDEHLSVDINALPDQAKELFFEAARQRRITQRFMEETKLQSPDLTFNPRSGTRIGLSADQPTRFGVNAEYMDEVLGNFGMSLDDFGGDVDAAMSALDEVQEGFFDENIEAIRLGNPTEAQKRSLRKRQQEFEKAQAERVRLLEELDKVQSRDRWTTKDYERHAELREASKRNLNQVLHSAARLGLLRQAVAGSLEAAPVTARNLLLYARQVVPEQIKSLQQMLKNEVGDPKVINEMIEELRAVPSTLDELNDANTYLSYLRDVRDVPNPTTSGRAGSATRNPTFRRRGTALDATYIEDLRSRLFAQDMEFQRHRIAQGVRDVVHEKGLSKTGADLLRSEQFGLTSQQIAEMTPGQIVDALGHAGYKVYEPNQMFELRRSPQGDPLEAHWIREDVGNILTQGLKGDSWLETILQSTYDKVQRGWKVAVLPFRPAWQVNNIFGNALLSMLVGKVGLADYASLMRGSAQAVHEWNQGLARTIRIPLSERWIKEMQDALPSMEPHQRALTQKMLDDGAITLDNTTLNDIASNGLIQGDFAFLNNSQFFRTLTPREEGFLRRAGLRTSPPRMPKNLEELGDVGVSERMFQRTRNLRATGREFVDYAYHVNETIDNMHRTMIYLDQMRKGSDHAEAISMVNKALGDYNKLSDFERRWVRRVYPFWPWMRHMLETVTRSLSPDNIGRSLIFAHVTNILGEPNVLEELLPEYAAGDIFVGYGEEGTPQFLSTRGLNPFLDVFDPLTQPNMRGLTRPMGPLLTMLDERRTGISNLTGRPFSSPINRADQQVPRPPLFEQIIRQVPQARALRDVYREATGQPLTRYGTGEAAIFPGAEKDKNAASGLVQLFGANIRPMDVEQMRAREKLRLFQEEQDRARQEAKERQYRQQHGRSLTQLFR